MKRMALQIGKRVRNAKFIVVFHAKNATHVSMTARHVTCQDSKQESIAKTDGGTNDRFADR